MPQPLTFTTKISGQTERGLELRGHLLTDLIQEANFVATFFLSLTGRKPTQAEETILNAILVSAIDHGLYAPSGFTPRVVASSGNEALTAMAATLLALGPYHGGAITGAMQVFAKLQLALTTDGTDMATACQNLVAEYQAQKKRLPGYGHPHYTEVDPRTQQLFGLAEQQGLDLHVIELAKTLQDALATSLGKRLVINIDGAIAVLLVTLGFDPKVGNALFGLARVAGSIAHIVEEQNSGEWVRRLLESDVTYQP